MSTRDILLVDDEICSLRTLSTILESNGYDVRATSDGSKALEIMKHDVFKMMITDFDMPKMNGVELATKAREQYPELLVVMVTGGNLPDIIEPAAHAGISLVFSKPVNLGEFVATIRSSLPTQSTAA